MKKYLLIFSVLGLFLTFGVVNSVHAQTPATTTPPITITFPNGGESFPQGSVQMIQWNYNAAYFGATSTTSVSFGIISENGGTMMSLGSMPISYRKADIQIPSTLPSGRYKVKISYPVNAVANDYSDNYFSVKAYSTTTNTSPYFTSIVGPILVQRGRSGVWTMSMADNENNLSRLQINWGDGTLSSTTISGGSVTNSLSHIYGSSGTKVVTYNLTDSLGLSNVISSTVVVTEPKPVTPTSKTPLSSSLIESAQEQINEMRSWLDALLGLFR